MAELIINGRPLVVFETQLPSWNETIEMANKRPRFARSHAHARAPLTTYIQKWRNEGAKLANEFMQKVWWLKDEHPYLVQKRGLVVVKVGRATIEGESSETSYDVHNAYCKAFFDGFSDAGVWKDDAWMYVPWVIYGWVHMSQLDAKYFKGMNTHVIEVYELDRVCFNGQDYVLPEWRD